MAKILDSRRLAALFPHLAIDLFDQADNDTKKLEIEEAVKQAYLTLSSASKGKCPPGWKDCNGLCIPQNDPCN